MPSIDNLIGQCDCLLPNDIQCVEWFVCLFVNLPTYKKYRLASQAKPKPTLDKRLPSAISASGNSWRVRF